MTTIKNKIIFGVIGLALIIGMFVACLKVIEHYGLTACGIILIVLWVVEVAAYITYMMVVKCKKRTGRRKEDMLD